MKLSSLNTSYLEDKHSPYHKVRHVTKVSYERHIARLNATLGDYEISDFKTRQILDLYEEWTVNHGLSMAHSLIAQMRIVTRFGASVLENEECQKLRGLLSGMRFANAKPRQLWMEPEQAVAICESAAAAGEENLALAQAIQYECALRQKDIIGERVPLTDPTPALLIDGDEKWVRGIVREEIDANLVLKHETSKRGQVLQFNLKKCPLVMKYWPAAPDSGPLILNPYTARPFLPWQYRRMWRKHATLVGVPRNVWNMDSRAGRITEVLAKGVGLDDARKLAGHEQATTTVRYSRAAPEAIERAFDVINAKAG